MASLSKILPRWMTLAGSAIAMVIFQSKPSRSMLSASSTSRVSSSSILNNTEVVLCVSAGSQGGTAWAASLTAAGNSGFNPATITSRSALRGMRPIFCKISKTNSRGVSFTAPTVRLTNSSTSLSLSPRNQLSIRSTNGMMSLDASFT